MNATLSRKLRFSDAVYALNTTPKALRNWLQRDLVQIHTPKPEGAGWTEYSFFDIAILALVRTFVNFGVNVQEASALANAAMRFYSQMLDVKKPEDMPARALAILWTNQRLYLFKNGDDWQFKHVALYDTKIMVGDPLLPSDVAALRREHEPVSVFLSIDMETILLTAFERADESANEGKNEEFDE